MKLDLTRNSSIRQIERMMCLTCMAEYFETTEEELKDRIRLFKNQGCIRFG